MGAIAGNLAVALAQGEAVEAPMTYIAGDAEVPLHPVEDFNVTIDNMADYLAQYSPGYVDAAAVVAGLDASILPAGLEQYR
jgi:hypothetical protein